MPKGTVTEHKDGTVKLTVPFNATVTNFRFFSSDDGAGPAENMVLRKTVAAPPNSPTGFHSFVLTDGDLGIRPDRGAHIRIGTDVSGVFSSKFAEPLTFIKEADNGKTIRGSTSAADFNGTVGKGLFDFQQKERVMIKRVTANFNGVSVDFTLAIRNAAGKETLLAHDNADSFVIRRPFPLEKGEVMKLVTTGASADLEAEATRE